ncbi:MAG: hypothetical protein ACOC3B_01360 [Bacillota bacterium]
MNKFPRTKVGGKSLSRMIIGTNWILGFSHRGPAADYMIKKRHSSKESIAEILVAFLERGVDTLMAPFAGNQHLIDAVKLAEDKTSKEMIMIDTPIINVDDNQNARQEAEKVICRVKIIKGVSLF